MKKRRTFLLIISLLLFSTGHLFAQEETAQEIQTDSIAADTVPSVPIRYGIRLGLDLSKPIRTFLDDDYKGLEIKGDYRIKKNWYIAAELGTEEKLSEEQTVTAFAKGSYGKLGADYNAYVNWEGMHNMIYVGARYGFSSFTTELRQYGIYNTDPYFGPDIRTESLEFSGLTASWLELQLGVKVEVLTNLYLGAHIEVKRLVSQQQPENFDNLYIPGFNRTYDFGSSGIGFGYSISYFLPLYRK